MPPLCTPEKHEGRQRELSDAPSPQAGYVTPPHSRCIAGGDSKSDRERRHMDWLAEKFPSLSEIFTLHRQIGEGTFSAVFVASVAGGAGDKLYAIKHLVPTMHPMRIEVELRCLQLIGGQDNVVGLDLCLRENENVLLVMPYLRHDSFSDYFQEMGAAETAHYMRQLLRALSRVHRFGIIHRDIKPNNFLYDRRAGRFLLVDFGLAQVCGATGASGLKRKRGHDGHGDHDDRSEEDGAPPKRRALHTRNFAALASTARHLQRSSGAAARPSKENVPRAGGGGGAPSARRPAAGGGGDVCRCFGRPSVCRVCLLRRPQDAPRAGTPGFRPPEVLLKHAHQTTAVDVWAAGVVLLCILSGAYPFFRAPDDLAALAEMVTLFGTDAVRSTARRLGKHLLCSEARPPLDLRRVCRRLRARRRGAAHHAHHAPDSRDRCDRCDRCEQPRRGCLCAGSAAEDDEEERDEFPEAAYDLLRRLLDVDPHTRISAEDALKHAFLAEPRAAE